MSIIILPEADRDAVLSLLCKEHDFCKQMLGEDYTGAWGRLMELFEKAPDEHTIRVVVEDCAVRDVKNLPMGFSYEVQDFDDCSDCGNAEPRCNWCKENG